MKSNFIQLVSLLMILFSKTLLIASENLHEHDIVHLRKYDYLVYCAMEDNPHLIESFELLHNEKLIAHDFYDFVTKHLQLGNQESNLDEIVKEAEDLVCKTMKNECLQMINESTPASNNNLDQIKNPTVRYMMQFNNIKMQHLIRSWINLKDDYGKNILHTAVWRDQQDLTRICMNPGADLNIQNKDGYTPLHIAAFNNRKNITWMLIAAGAGINQQNNNGETPLHLASFYNHYEIVWMLIGAKAHMNIATHHGLTPLHAAVSSNSVQAVDMLVHRGAQTDIRNFSGEFAQDLSHKNEIQAIFDKKSVQKIRSQKTCRPIS